MDVVFESVFQSLHHELRTAVAEAELLSCLVLDSYLRSSAEDLGLVDVSQPPVRTLVPESVLVLKVLVSRLSLLALLCCLLSTLTLAWKYLRKSLCLVAQSVRSEVLDKAVVSCVSVAQIVGSEVLDKVVLSCVSSESCEVVSTEVKTENPERS